MAKITTILDLKILGTEKLVNLEKEIQSTEAALKKLDKTDKKNARTIAEKRVSLKGLRSERNQEQKTVLAVNTATKKLDGSYNSLVKRNKALLTSLKASKGGMKGSSKEIKKMKEEYKKNNEKLKEFDKTLGNNQRNVGNYGSALGNMKEKMGKMGLAIGGAMMAFMALSRTVGMLINDFSEFEKTFTNVLTLMSSGDIEQFHGEMQDGMLNIIAEYGFAIEDVNKALFDSVSAGVPAAQSVEFMNTASQLALGGVTDLSTAVDGMTTIMNAFQLETSEASKIANAFFTAQKFGKTTVEELSNSIGMVAPHAKRAGMSYQELLAAMAELTKQGIKTDLAATALKSTITAIEKPSEKAKKAFDKLGIAYGTNAVRSEGLMNILTQITAAGADNADVLTELIPNIRALTGVSAMGAEQLQDYDNILQSVNLDYGENSSLAKAVEMQQDTLSQAQERLNGEWTKQKIMLGDKMKPVFANVIKALSWMVKNLPTIGRVLKGIVVTWGAYNLAMAVAAFRTKILTGAITMQTIKQRILNMVANMNPYVMLASVILGVVAAVSSQSEVTEEAVEVQDRYQKVIAENAKISATADDNIKTEIAKVTTLSNTIRDETTSRKQKQTAIDEMNKNYGTTLSYMSDEEQMANALATAYANAIEQIKAKIVMQASQEKLINLVKEELTLREELKDLTGLEGTTTEIREQAMTEWVRLNRVQNKLIEEETSKIKRRTNESDIEHNHRVFQSLETNEAYQKLRKSIKNYEFDTLLATQKVDGLTEKQKGLQVEINDAAKILDKYVVKTKTQTAVVLSSAQALTMQEGTLGQVKEKIKALTAALDDEVLNSESYKKIQLEIIRLRKLSSQTIKKEGDVKKTAVEKLQEEIKWQQYLRDTLEGVIGMEDEYNKAKVKALTDQIRLIKMQAQETGVLTQVQIDQLNLLQIELDKFNKSLEDPETEKSPLEKAMYGEGVQEAFAMAGAALDGLAQIQDGANQLAKVEFDNEMFRMETEKSTELKNLTDSAKYKKMTDEQKTKATEKITKKHDTKITELKLEEFERNKKLQLSEAKMSGAQAIMRIWSGQITSNPVIDAIIKGGLVLLQLRRTNQEIQAINKAVFKGAKGGIIPKLAKGGMVHGNSHKDGGVKFAVGGAVAELEGGEAVINKRSTAMFRNQLSDMNVAGGGKRFADGGLVLGALAKAQTRSLLTEEDIIGIAGALSHQRVTVTESEITGTQNTISVLESRATF